MCKSCVTYLLTKSYVLDRIKNGIISLTFRDPERSRSLNEILDAEYLAIGAI